MGRYSVRLLSSVAVFVSVVATQSPEASMIVFGDSFSSRGFTVLNDFQDLLHSDQVIPVIFKPSASTIMRCSFFSVCKLLN